MERGGFEVRASIKRGGCLMGDMAYYKAYPRDFIEGTIGMSFELKSAYRLVLDLIYMQDGQLPDDARYISGLLNCSVRKWNGFRKELLSLGKIEIIDGFISNYRAVTEVESYRKLCDKNAENRAQRNKNKDLGVTTVEQARVKPEPEDIKDTTNVVSKKPPKKKRKIDDVFKTDRRLPDEYRSEAIRLGLNQPDSEWDSFFDFWQSEGVGKVDWLATWRNRVRKAVQRQGIGGTDQARTNRPAVDATIEGARIAIGRRRAADGRPHQPDKPPSYG